MKRKSALLIGLFLFGEALHAATLVEESFESGGFEQRSMSNGASFRWSPSSVNISDAVSRTGTFSAQFVYGPDAEGEDSWRELGFRFGSPMSQVWVEYWIYYPDNYLHRTQSGPSNNKFFQLNYNGSPKQLLTVESAAQGNGTSGMRRFLSTTQKPDGSTNWPVNDSSTNNFIGDSEDFAIQLGRWTKVLIHYKAGSDGVRSDGRAEVWVNDELIHGLDWPFWEPDNKGQINGGYILGWANSGFSQATRIYVDDFKVYDSPPEMVGEMSKPMPPADFSVGD
ncbi:hypothetical protein EDB94_3114 [Marinobacter sp. 3-2]|jgi:hypothetical protein|uniref:hypothetical protein n=1 Tax=Marinobacter sp. 3-2 TaxID=2485141 RepID=UPI000D377FA6|nr:hypothetical protein [Marinobacter sp. 3-2]ROQ42898.1 hypothetical protein EDB94_3114 [Marinobacter sp. 3-2]